MLYIHYYGRYDIGMILELALAAVLSQPTDGSQYELCAIRMGDGSVIGTTQQPCADASPKNGIRIEGKVYQNCDRTSKDICFTYQSTGKTIIYTIHVS